MKGGEGQREGGRGGAKKGEGVEGGEGAERVRGRREGRAEGGTGWREGMRNTTAQCRC